MLPPPTSPPPRAPALLTLVQGVPADPGRRHQLQIDRPESHGHHGERQHQPEAPPQQLDRAQEEQEQRGPGAPHGWVPRRPPPARAAPRPAPCRPRAPGARRPGPSPAPQGCAQAVAPGHSRAGRGLMLGPRGGRRRSGLPTGQSPAPLSVPLPVAGSLRPACPPPFPPARSLALALCPQGRVPRCAPPAAPRAVARSGATAHPPVPPPHRPRPRHRWAPPP